MEFIITVVYWLVIHEWLMKLIGHDPILVFINVWIHILPFVAMILNVFLSKMGFSMRRWRVTCLISTIFMFVNFIGVKIVGQPLYFFLPWNDF